MFVFTDETRASSFENIASLTKCKRKCVVSRFVQDSTVGSSMKLTKTAKTRNFRSFRKIRSSGPCHLRQHIKRTSDIHVRHVIFVIFAN